jgi:uncharacterized membrane protein
MIIAIVVLVLSVIGFADSLYYTLIHYGYLGFQVPLVPMICDLKEGACRTVATSRWASIVGLPNSVWGMGFYALTTAAGAARLYLGKWPYLTLLRMLSVLAVFFSIVLAGTMFLRLRTVCPLCVLAQIINVILLTIFLMVKR